MTRNRSRCAWLAGLALACASPALAQSTSDRDAPRQADWPGTSSEASFGPTVRNTLLIGASATAVAAYGAKNWWHGGFGGGFDSENEGWFGSGTQFGGVDKLGHAYSNYVGVRLLAPLFEGLGNTRDTSLSLALWTTLGAFTAVEVIDAYSRAYHFSLQDAISNVAGVWFGYAVERSERLDETFDFRLWYRRSPYADKFDPFGDYSGMRFLLVAKADAFPSLREQGLFRYLEIAVGYGAQGFDADPGVVVDRKREVYFGVSLNLSRVLADAFYDGRSKSTTTQRVADWTFDVIQFFPPFAYGRRGLD